MWFIYALLGAFGKSYSGLFRKKMAGNVGTATFMWVSYCIILLLLTPFMVSRFGTMGSALRHAPLVLGGAAVSLLLATVLNMEALKREQLSFIAPLNAFVPIFTFVIAAVFLGEHPPSTGVLGILIIFLGAYIVNLRPGKVRWYEPIRHLLTNTGALLSLGVALGYAVNTVLIKQASDLGYDEFTILFLMLAISWVLLLYVPLTKRHEVRSALRSNKAVLVGAAASSFVGSIFHILAVAGTYASYAVSVRRFDTVISVLLGWHHLKESNIRNKLIGSVTMTIGAIVMAIS